MVRVGEMGPRGEVMIPKEILRALNIKVGDLLGVRAEGVQIIIRKVRQKDL